LYRADISLGELVLALDLPAHRRVGGVHRRGCDQASHDWQRSEAEAEALDHESPAADVSIGLLSHVTLAPSSIGGRHLV
jgi:hypothetical protein